MADRRKKGKGSIRERKDGRWEGRVVVGYDDKGLPKTKNVLAKTRAECDKKLNELVKASFSITGKLPGQAKPSMPFGDWIDLWYRNYSRNTIQERTRSGYENRIYNHIIPEIGDIPLFKLSQNDLQEFYMRLKLGGRLQYTEQCGKGVSDRMVRACHASCRMALSTGKRYPIILSGCFRHRCGKAFREIRAPFTRRCNWCLIERNANV